MTIKEAAQLALNIQDACNLSGVVFSFAKVMELICEESNKGNHGTEWKNSHPIVILFVDKLADLCGIPHTEEINTFRVAYDQCYKLAEMEPSSRPYGI